MMFFERHKRKIIVISIILVSLVCTFLYEGNVQNTHRGDNQAQTEADKEVSSKNRRNKKTKKAEKKEETEENSFSEEETKKETLQTDTDSVISEEKTELAQETDEDSEAFSASVSEYQPPKPSVNEIDADNKKFLCTISVKCGTILNNLELFDKEKLDILPEDGIIYSERSVTVSEGETVYDVLAREMKKNKIHFEYTKTPVSGQVYIEGINNIYEFDCGELSGWLYKVNGYCPNYACSEYKLSSGDKIEILYTCDLGADTGGYNSGRKTE